MITSRLVLNNLITLHVKIHRHGQVQVVYHAVDILQLSKDSYLIKDKTFNNINNDNNI